MDYEKLYNEALERAKKVKHDIENIGCVMSPDMLEVIFPELAESEDERMVRAIEHILYENYSDAAIIEGVEIAEIVAWLEKQKERKPISQEDFDRAKHEALREEQKPSEWSEEDERIRKTILGFLNQDKGGTKYSSYAQLAEWSNWLKSLRPSWKSTEDEERLINTSISFLKDFADKGYENAVECIDWLKSKLNGNSCK